MDWNFFVKDSIALLHYYTGKNWSRREVETLPAGIKENEYTECVWFNPATGYKHYTRRYVDTLIDSVTVKNGRIVKYYIYSYEV